MQLALLSGASPRSCEHGPTVRLLEGTWRLDVQGLVDSQLLLSIDGFTYVAHSGLNMRVGKDAKAQIVFATRGTEEYLTVLAEKVA